MADKTITLTSPHAWFGNQVTRIVLREPRAGHLQRFGEPRMPVYQTDGARFHVDRDDIIARYFDALLSLDGTAPVDGGAAPLLAELSLEDGIALRDALFDFFSDARQEIFRKSRMSSSSA